MLLGIIGGLTVIDILARDEFDWLYLIIRVVTMVAVYLFFRYFELKRKKK